MHISIKANSSGTTSAGLFNYLDKENEIKDAEINLFNYNNDIDNFATTEMVNESSLFFNQDIENGNEKFVDNKEAVDMIDGNRGDTKLDDANFYLLNISPSKNELEHIQNLVNEELIKNGISKKDQSLLENNKQIATLRNEITHQYLRFYTREVMKDYVENFKQTTFINPNKLPTDWEMRKINDFANRALKNLMIDKKDENYQSKKNEIMETKALEKGFDLSKRAMNESDILWYAKVEQTRTYKADDKWVIENKKKFKQIENFRREGKNIEAEAVARTLKKDNVTNLNVVEGMQKGGLQYHAHVVVSRHEKNVKDKRFKKSLNPLTNQRGGKQFGKEQTFGFNRSEFFKTVEKSFDQTFKYERKLEQSYEYRNSKKKFVNNSKAISKVLANNLNPSSKIINHIVKDARQELRKGMGLNEIDKLNPRKMLSREMGVNIPLKIPATKIQALSMTVNLIKNTVSKVIDAGIGR